MQPQFQGSSDELKRLQLPQQNCIRRKIRAIGLIVLSIGFACVAIAMASFFSAFGGDEPPRFFWLGFIGLPLMFVGTSMCLFGFMGALMRFQAGEVAPVAADTANYLA